METYIESDGIRVHAKLDKPAGKDKCPLCIVVHGYTGHMEEPHIIAVSKAINEIGIATLRVEMYGHGGSDGTFAEHTLYKWVTNMLSVISYAKSLDFVTDLFITGHSQGGLLTMLVGGMCPDDFKAILPLSPAWMIPEEARHGILLGIPFDPVHIPDTLDVGDGRTLNGDYLRVAQTIHPEDEIARYHGPVLIVHGDADESVPYSYALKANEFYSHSALVTIPGDTHCYNNHLDMVTAAVKDFLNDLI